MWNKTWINLLILHSFRKVDTKDRPCNSYSNPSERDLKPPFRLNIHSSRWQLFSDMFRKAFTRKHSIKYRTFYRYVKRYRVNSTDNLWIIFFTHTSCIINALYRWRGINWTISSVRLHNRQIYTRIDSLTIQKNLTVQSEMMREQKAYTF